MEVIVNPSTCHGKVCIPPSKSMTHRAIICASLANGTSILHNISLCDDTKATIHAMETLGANIQWKDKHTILITGIKNVSLCSPTTIFCKESGSTLRFLIPLCTLFQQQIIFKGEGRLMKRPQHVYEQIFQKQGISFQKDQDRILINGTLQADHFHVKGNISSQFITGLLFTLPLLQKDSIITIEPPLESKSYIDMTIQILEQFGIRINQIDDYNWKIKGGQIYQPCEYTIEGDYSQFAFFAVLSAINHDLYIEGIHEHSLQGDKVIIDILKRSNVQIEKVHQGYIIKKSDIHPFEVDLSDCPDLGPILMVLATHAKGTSRIYNAARLRLKESDRISAMEMELKKIGIDIHSSIDEVIIKGAECYEGVRDFHSHFDHRIVMSLSVLATKAQQSCTIQDAHAISKSYPEFFHHLQNIGISITIK